eukprot:g14239.t1
MLIAQVLAQSFCVLGVLETNHTHDTSKKAAANAGDGVVPGMPAETRAADEDIFLAARHCVALDGSRHFPPDHSLGLFSMSGAPVGTRRITAASVEFVPHRRRAKGGTLADHTGTAGNLGVSLLFEIDLGDERAEEKGGEAPALGLHAAHGAGESIPTRAEVETAAVEAAAVTDDEAKAQLVISALAAWNLVSINGVAKEGTAAAMELRIEVAAAFGYRGDRYTSSKSLDLHLEHGYTGGNVVPFSASFDWHLTGDVWANLDVPSVADVKVYGAPAGAMTGSTSTHQGDLLLLQATLCRRASPGAVTGTTTKAVIAPMKAILGPYIEKSEYATLEQAGGAAFASAGEEGGRKRRRKNSELSKPVDELAGGGVKAIVVRVVKMGRRAADESRDGIL